MLLFAGLIISISVTAAEDSRTMAERAFKKNPADPALKMAFAGTAPCSTAAILYKELAEGQGVPDSIRAEAWRRLGDLSYASKEFSRAVESYRNAAKESSNPVYRHLWALASMASGDTDAAQSLWHTLSLEYGDEHSQMAQYYMGLLQLKKGDYLNAYNSFLKTGSTDPGRPWTVASLAGKLECAVRLEMTDKVKLYREQLEPLRQHLLEKDLLQLSTGAGIFKTDTAAPAEEKSVPSAPDSSKTTPAEAFTLQIGAFGSAENAANLQKKLAGKYSDVSVLPVTLGEQILYRVRIGTFPTKEAAEKYAADSLKNTDLNYRVVEK